MKTTNVRKKPVLFSFIVLLFLGFSIQLTAQDKGKELNLKIIGEKDGERTVIDTNFYFDDIMSLEKMKSIEEEVLENVLENLDMDLDNLEEFDDLVKDILDEAGNLKKMMIIYNDTAESIQQHKVNIMQSDSADGNRLVKMIIGENGYEYFITEDKEAHEVSVGGSGQKVIIRKKKGGGIEYDSDDLIWTSANMKNVQVISTEDGKKVVVTDENGKKREYQLEDGKGTYLIDENGELKKIDYDVKWIDENVKGAGKIFLNVDDDGKITVIQSDGSNVKIDDMDNRGIVFIQSSDHAEHEHDIHVEVVKQKNGEEEICIREKILIKTLTAEDIETLNESGVDIKSGNTEQLKLEGLHFFPNPSSGKFQLKFDTPDTGYTEVAIYDINGKQVYFDKIKNFNGSYKKEIDISTEKSGTYFLKILQKDKSTTKKIILE